MESGRLSDSDTVLGSALPLYSYVTLGGSLNRLELTALITDGG